MKMTTAKVVETSVTAINNSPIVGYVHPEHHSQPTWERSMDKILFSFCNVVVPLLTYLLMKKDLTPEEVNGHVVDVVAGGVDTVRNSNDNSFD